MQGARKIPLANKNGKESFHFYKKNAKHRKDKKNTYRKYQHQKVVSSFWEKVAEYMTERKGGVYVDRLGYFSIGMVPGKTFPFSKNKYGKKYLNPHTNSRVYFPLFVPNPDKYMKVFTMDRTFSNKKIVKPLTERLKNGQKYLNYFEYIYKTFVYKYRKIVNK